MRNIEINLFYIIGYNIRSEKGTQKNIEHKYWYKMYSHVNIKNN